MPTPSSNISKFGGCHLSPHGWRGNTTDLCRAGSPTIESTVEQGPVCSFCRSSFGRDSMNLVAIPSCFGYNRRIPEGAFVMAKAAVELSGWERALMAAEKVKERLRRATRALDAAGVPYAVAGGNAVAEWVGRLDEDAVRKTRDVDLLVRRADLPAARPRSKLPGSSIITSSISISFIDGPQGKPSDGIHFLFAGEKVRRDDEHSLPDIDESERAVEFQVANLEALVRMKLIAYRR